MLILTRRIGQAVHIGDNTTVVIVGVKGEDIRVGIQAPKEIPVHREEIFQRILLERSGTDAGMTDASTAPAVSQATVRGR